MSAARPALTAVVLLLAVIALSEGLRMASGPKKCCFEFTRQFPKTRVASYTRTSQQCPIPAVLLNTVKGRQVCARPNESWVMGIVNYLDSRKIVGGNSIL